MKYKSIKETNPSLRHHYKHFEEVLLQLRLSFLLDEKKTTDVDRVYLSRYITIFNLFNQHRVYHITSEVGAMYVNNLKINEHRTATEVVSSQKQLKPVVMENGAALWPAASSDQSQLRPLPAVQEASSFHAVIKHSSCKIVQRTKLARCNNFNENLTKNCKHSTFKHTCCMIYSIITKHITSVKATRCKNLEIISKQLV